MTSQQQQRNESESGSQLHSRQAEKNSCIEDEVAIGNIISKPNSMNDFCLDDPQQQLHQHQQRRKSVSSQKEEIVPRRRSSREKQEKRPSIFDSLFLDGIDDIESLLTSSDQTSDTPSTNQQSQPQDPDVHKRNSRKLSKSMPPRIHKKSSWVISDWDDLHASNASIGGLDESSADEEDDNNESLYHVLDNSSSSISKKKISLHQTLMEEELSFKRSFSLVWYEGSNFEWVLCWLWWWWECKCFVF